MNPNLKFKTPEILNHFSLFDSSIQAAITLCNRSHIIHAYTHKHRKHHIVFIAPKHMAVPGEFSVIVFHCRGT